MAKGEEAESSADRREAVLLTIFGHKFALNSRPVRE